MKDIIIAIDGVSSTGKSTLAKLLAKELGYTHIDSGAMYRVVTLFALENGWIEGNNINETKLIESLPEINIDFEWNPVTEKNEITLNGKNVDGIIRELEVSSKVSLIAKIAEVRTFLVEIQQKLGKNKKIVMDGRDIGTTVFPNAELKIFLTASPETRANRRLKEFRSKDPDITFEEVLKNVEERDLIDTTREISPLIIADDAIEIDNGNMTAEETFSAVMNLVNNLKPK